MIVFQSQLTGVAEPPSFNQRSTTEISSPGGEETGEGELNPRERGERHFLCCSFVGELSHRGRQSALISVQASVPRHAWPVTLLATFHVVAKIRVYRFVAPKLCEGGCPSVVKKLLNCQTNPIFNASLYQ